MWSGMGPNQIRGETNGNLEQLVMEKLESMIGEEVK